MLLRGLIFISVVLVGILFADVDASSSFPKEKITSCGHVEFQQCWCFEEDPCGQKHKKKKIDTTDFIPVISKKNILTAKYINNHIQSDSPTELNLSRKKLEGIDRNAFDNYTDLKSLDLSNNNLSKLPAFIFSKLTNLENLDLSGNGMKMTSKLFAGLNNLKSLNITNNALNKVLKDNCFFGLTKSCDIHITPDSVNKMATGIFGNEPSTSVQDPTEKASNDKVPKTRSIHTRSALQWPSDSRKITGFQVCIKNHTVQEMDELKPFKQAESGCQEVSLRYGHLNLENMEIIDFEKGWFRVQEKDRVPYSLSVLRIAGNNMPRVTEAVVNGLPEYITWLDMKNNKIERLEKGTFVHNYIFSLELNDNLIADIEDNTFNMPKLYQLYLRNNRLKNTKFLATMPASLNSIDLEDNEIMEISPNSFSTLKQLGWLNLDRNMITTIGNTCFHGATNLGSIILSKNNITTVEPGAFDNLSAGVITLANNNISNIEKGVFNNLVVVQRLNIGGNKLTKILSGSFDLPTVERLDLSNNQITEIEKGAVKGLGNLNELILSSNQIEKLENGVLFGLNKTTNCHVILEHSPVELIQGGVFDDV